MNLIAIDFPTVSPLEHWPRSMFMIFFGAYFAVLSLKFLKNIKQGSSITVHPGDPLLSFLVLNGRVNLTKLQQKQGFIKSYNGPASTAALGLLFYFAAQIMIVMMFKTIDYTFA